MASGSLRFFSRLFYRSIYLLLYIVLLGLLLITPGDAITRSLQNQQMYNIWIIAIAYFVTIFLVCFIYAMRLYVNKTVLASIPKGWVPIDKTDVNKRVYRMISTALNRSAAIAYEAHPMVETIEGSRELISEHARMGLGFKKTKTIAEEIGVALPPHGAVWGPIEHNGWSSPNSTDLPNLQYTTVLLELPNLIEARALSFAPLDPMSQSDPPVLDAEAVSLLQRAPHLGLRNYIEHLAGLGVLPMDSTSTDFLTQYEHARYSHRPQSNARFRELMHLFAQVLRSIGALDLDVFDSFPSEGDEDWPPSESDVDDDAPLRTNPSTPRSNLSRSVTMSSDGSVRRTARDSSTNTRGQYLTAPTTPRSRQAGLASRQSSSNSFAQTRHPYPVSQPSSASLRSQLSSNSQSSGSVIRLATSDDAADLPYVLTLNNTSSN